MKTPYYLAFTVCLAMLINVSQAQVNTSLDNNIRDVTDLDIGFNRRSDNGTWWTDLSFINLLEDMNPDVLRFPGGTQANYWDWRTGQFIENTDKIWGLKEVLTISQFVSALPNRTKIIYVVNMARPTPATGVNVNADEATLKSDVTLNLKIEDMIDAIDEFVAQGKEPYAVELGNEFFFGNIESGIYEIIEVVPNSAYTSGWDEANSQPYTSASRKEANVINAKFYLKHCKAIVEAIKLVYPNMKFVLTTTREEAIAPIRERWNTTIFDQLENNPDYAALKNDIYAVTQHHYLNNKYGEQSVISDNASAKTAIAEGISYPLDTQSDYNLVPNDYKIWYTEYGDIKFIAEETWASALRYAVWVYSWISLGDKVGQLGYHYISDRNVVKVGSPMKLAPIGIAAKLVSKATADMSNMQKINFETNPESVNGVLSLYGYKFKSIDKETLLIININDVDFNEVNFDNLISYTGQPLLTQYNSITPYVSGVDEGDSKISSIVNLNITNQFDAKGFSISVIEVPNTSLSSNKISKERVAIFPNPAKDFVNIKTDHDLLSVSIYSLNGNLVYQVEQLENNVINLSQLSSGMYLMKIHTKNSSEFKKLIVY